MDTTQGSSEVPGRGRIVSQLIGSGPLAGRNCRVERQKRVTREISTWGKG